MSPLDQIIEIILSLSAWGVQLAVTAGLAALLGLALAAVSGRIRRKKAKFLPRFLAMLVLLCTVLAVLAMKPPVICPDEYQDGLTGDLHMAIQTQSSGIYSNALPLVPAFAKVTSLSGDRVYYDIRYLYFGTVKMSYSAGDGYNCEKSLLPT